MKHVTDLTICRAAFAAWVFAYHLNLPTHYAPLLGPFGDVIARGHMGVDGFFILSGMVLAHAHPELPLSWTAARAFWAKRLVRIYPVHLATLLALALMVGSAMALGVQPREPERFGPGELVNHVLLIHAWGFSERWAWNYPSWSISAEWAGYLLFPLFWVWLRPRGAVALACVLVLALAGAMAARGYAAATGLTLTFDGGLIRFFPEFVAGIATVPLLPALASRVSGRWLALAGAALTAPGAALAIDAMALPGLWALLTGLMLAARQGRGAVLGGSRALIWLGELSYAFYMCFALAETMLATLFRRVAVDPAEAKLAYIGSMTALTLLLAVTAWYCVERPALRAYAGRGGGARRAVVPAGVRPPA